MPQEKLSLKKLLHKMTFNVAPSLERRNFPIGSSHNKDLGRVTIWRNYNFVIELTVACGKRILCMFINYFLSKLKKGL